VVYELALDDEGACADNGFGRVGNAEEEVFVVALGHPFVALVPLLDNYSPGISHVRVCVCVCVLGLTW